MGAALCRRHFLKRVARAALPFSCIFARAPFYTTTASSSTPSYFFPANRAALFPAWAYMLVCECLSVYMCGMGAPPSSLPGRFFFARAGYGVCALVYVLFFAPRFSHLFFTFNFAWVSLPTLRHICIISHAELPVICETVN